MAGVSAPDRNPTTAGADRDRLRVHRRRRRASGAPAPRGTDPSARRSHPRARLLGVLHAAPTVPRRRAGRVAPSPDPCFGTGEATVDGRAGGGTSLPALQPRRSENDTRVMCAIARAASSIPASPERRQPGAAGPIRSTTPGAGGRLPRLRRRCGGAWRCWSIPSGLGPHCRQDQGPGCTRVDEARGRAARAAVKSPL